MGLRLAAGCSCSYKGTRILDPMFDAAEGFLPCFSIQELQKASPTTLQYAIDAGTE
jgi:hypothetical protein